MEIADFCREIEAYLCKKNDGHLIRVVGPSFDLVSDWARRGVPLKVACSGIDRYFERYYRNGPRRRPVKIDFCEADVLDVFDEWRRATGVRTSTDEGAVDAAHADAARASLPAHLQRALTRLTSARASGSLGPEFDPLIDRLAMDLDAARSKAGGLRGDARAAMVARLDEADVEMLAKAAESLDRASIDSVEADADVELAPFRSGMNDEEFARARGAAVRRLVRERLHLPTLRFV